MAPGRRSQRLTGHAGQVTCVDWHPTMSSPTPQSSSHRRVLALGSTDRTVRVVSLVQTQGQAQAQGADAEGSGGYYDSGGWGGASPGSLP
jgi:hypothetical protein